MSFSIGAPVWFSRKSVILAGEIEGIILGGHDRASLYRVKLTRAC